MIDSRVLVSCINWHHQSLANIGIAAAASLENRKPDRDWVVIDQVQYKKVTSWFWVRSSVWGVKVEVV